MHFTRHRLATFVVAVVASGTLVGSMTPAGAATAGRAPTGSARQAKAIPNRLHDLGGTSFAAAARPTAQAVSPHVTGPEVPNAPDFDQKRIRNAARRLPASALPNPPGSLIASANPGLTAFNGLDHADSRLADSGNQFSLEPPDTTVCIGGSFAMEGVNTALLVMDQKGTQLTPIVSLNRFFRLAPAIDRSGSQPIFGPFVGDVKCLFDNDIHRWFVTAFDIDTHPFTGAFTGSSRTLVAVSETSDPTGGYHLFAIDSLGSDAPGHSGCPCFDDQPLIGTDANGFFVSTNEFSLFGPDFNGAQVYALSKKGLAAAAHGAPAPTLVHLEGGPLAEGLSYSLQPATAPPNAPNAPGREYFLSALDFSATLDNRIAVWAADGTATLTTASPTLTLTSSVIDSQVYGQPPDVKQKAGPRPLGHSIGEPLNKLAGNDDRMYQVVFAHGRLWSALNTAIGVAGAKRIGAAWFEVDPTFAGGAVGGSVVHQGYVAVDSASVWFPAVAVNRFGKGAMAFTVAGPDRFPGSAYVTLDDTGTGPVHISAAGTGPADGFTGYAAFGGTGTERWGDYSTAAVDNTGRVWMATEDITNRPRTSLANWTTTVARVDVGH